MLDAIQFRFPTMDRNGVFPYVPSDEAFLYRI
jgi:hypothetical protein